MEDSLTVFPPDFVRRLTQLVPKQHLSAVITGLTTPRITTLRANTIKTDGVSLKKSLEEQGVHLHAVPWSEIAFIVRDTPLRELTELPEYLEGKLYVQSLSSMVPALILDPQPGDKVLDIAAAPGSKTTQIAALMGDTGEIVANDTSQIRRYRLEANLKTQGVTISKVTKTDGRSLWKSYPEYFDKVLVDVPCSMDGRFNTNEPKSFYGWSLKKVRDVALLQRWLLRSAISATKPGGIIVYSTCTLSPEENEEVIDWILKKDKSVVSVEEISVPNLPLAPALTSWAGKKFSAQLSLATRIYPSNLLEGFFIAKLRKLKSSVPKILLSNS